MYTKQQNHHDWFTCYAELIKMSIYLLENYHNSTHSLHPFTVLTHKRNLHSSERVVLPIGIHL